MNQQMKNDYDKSVEFWNSVLTFTEEDKEEALKDIQEEDWKSLATAEKTLLAASSFSQNQSVLDYGCGQGWASIIMAKTGCAHVDAVDVVANCENLGSFLAEAFHVEDKVDFRFVSTDWLGEQEDLYDGLFCSNVLDVVPMEIADEIVANMAKAVKKGANLVIGLNYYVGPDSAHYEKLVDGRYLFDNGILRLASRSDEEWTSLFEKYFQVDKLDHYAWPGEEKETRRLFYLSKK